MAWEIVKGLLLYKAVIISVMVVFVLVAMVIRDKMEGD